MIAFSSSKVLSLGLRWCASIYFLSCCSFADAGVISYTPGTGGTFDQSSASTFTAKNFGQGSLSVPVSYTFATVSFQWGGVGPNVGFSISEISARIAGSSYSFSPVTFLATTPLNTSVLSNQVSLSPTFSVASLATTELSFSIPTLAVADGWFLRARISFSDGDENTNVISSQTFTAVGSEVTPVPEPSSLAIVGLVGGVIAYRARRKATKIRVVEAE